MKPARPALAALAVAVVVSAGAANANPAGGPYRNGLIAFERCCGFPETGIYVIRPDGRGERRVFIAPVGDDAPLDPAWSPRGKQIAFVPGALRKGVWVMQANGTMQRQITVGRGDALFPSWSPGASWIVFSDLGTSRPGFHDLYVVRTNGTGLKRLTRTSADELSPAWAPNGGEIVYARGRDLWRMKADGSGRRRLTAERELTFVVTGRDAHRLRPRWRPVGDGEERDRARSVWCEPATTRRRRRLVSGRALARHRSVRPRRPDAHPGRRLGDEAAHE